MNNQNHTIIQTDSNALVSLAAISVLGDRDEQQDSFGYSLQHSEALVCVCDGMGGYQGGRQASNLAVDWLLRAYQNNSPCDNPTGMLLKAVKEADSAVARLKTPDGVPLRAGTTMVATFIKNGLLYWSSVGDSRAYLIRNGEFVQFTNDQNYRMVLNEKLQAGIISVSDYQREIVRGEALISYLGMGNVQLIDYNTVPLQLKKDDKIILMSDGLYKTLSDEQIARIIDNFSNIQESLQALEMRAKKNAKNNRIVRDNMTAVLIKVK